MKAMNILHKICVKKLDQLLLQKKELLANLEEATSLLEKHKEQVRDEYNKYYLGEYSIFLEKYLKVAKEKTSDFVVQISSIENHIKNIEEEIHEIFSEMKRYEIIISNNIKRKQKKELEREVKNLDELTIIKFMDR